MAENFFRLLKRERIRQKTYATRKQARADVFDYIEFFYNAKRKHGRNGNKIGSYKASKKLGAIQIDDLRVETREALDVGRVA